MSDFWEMPFFTPGSTRSLMSPESLEARQGVIQSFTGGDPAMTAIMMGALMEPGKGYADYMKKRAKVGIDPDVTKKVMDRFTMQAGGNKDALALLIDAKMGISVGAKDEMVTQMFGSGFNLEGLSSRTRDEIKAKFGEEGVAHTPVGDLKDAMDEQALLLRSSVQMLQDATLIWSNLGLQLSQMLSDWLSGGKTEFVPASTSQDATIRMVGMIEAKASARERKNLTKLHMFKNDPRGGW